MTSIESVEKTDACDYVRKWRLCDSVRLNKFIDLCGIQKRKGWLVWIYWWTTVLWESLCL